jgi:DNA-binding MarR family transcriptional regulator
MPDSPSPHRLAPLLRRSWYHLNQAFRRRIAAARLTPDQFTVLRWLVEQAEGITQRALADLMASDANTITSLLTRMQDAGLIERQADAHDRRCNILRATRKGRAIHARLQPEASALQDRVLSAIPSDERARFLAQLGSIAAACLDASQEVRSQVRKTRR